MIDFVLTDTSGVKEPLHDFVGKGHYVLVDIWASWCSACRRGIPHIKEAYALYHSRGLDIVSVSIDTKRKNWIEAVRQEAMPWPQVAANLLSDAELLKYGRVPEYATLCSSGDFLGAYLGIGVPLGLLFDPQGKLVARFYLAPLGYMDKALKDLYGGD